MNPFKKDLLLAAVIGGAVGLLVQPILLNVRSLEYVSTYVPLGVNALRALVFAVFLALAPAALALAKYVSRFLPLIYQVAKFAAVGTLNSFIDLGLFNLLGFLFGLPAGGSAKFVVMKSITFLVGTTNSYFWNRLWTFGSKAKLGGSEAAKFYAITIGNWLVNVGVATAVSTVYPANPVWVNLVSPISGIFAGMLGNFLGYKFIVFKQEDGRTTPAA